jgi:hypothetical protein
MENKKGQMQFALNIALGIIFLVALVIGVGYKFLRNNASTSALNITSADSEYEIVKILPLFVILIVLVAFAGYMYFKNK